MDESDLKTALRDLPLGGLRYLKVTGSTNDDALAWAAAGAADFSLVLADSQTNGRGRAGRRWFSLPGSGLALSLVLRPTPAEGAWVGRFAGLAALALLGALRQRGLSAQIKWPNDVLLGGRKLAGVLVESTWLGEKPETLVLGMGINLAQDAVPPDVELLFPATSLEDEMGAPPDPLPLLHDLLAELLRLRPQLGSDRFLADWEGALAFRDRDVDLWRGDQPPLRGRIDGLEEDGSLRLRSSDGRMHSLPFGEVHLRPSV